MQRSLSCWLHLRRVWHRTTNVCNWPLLSVDLGSACPLRCWEIRQQQRRSFYVSFLIGLVLTMFCWYREQLHRSDILHTVQDRI